MWKVSKAVFVLSVVFSSLGSKASPVRIITTSPSLTELVYQIGGQSKLVATVDYSFYPEAAKLLPSIGSFFSPSIETTLLYKPDLVLIDGAARNLHYEDSLKRLGIQTEIITISSVEKLYDAAIRLKKIFGSQSEIRQPVKPEALRKYSYIGFVWTSPSIVLSKNTFLSSLIAMSGGTNLCAFSSEQNYITVSGEWLMLLKPEVVYLLTEYDSQQEDFKKFTKKIWPLHEPKVLFLPSSQFARTTFTALNGFEKITEQLNENK